MTRGGIWSQTLLTHKRGAQRKFVKQAWRYGLNGIAICPFIFNEYPRASPTVKASPGPFVGRDFAHVKANHWRDLEALAKQCDDLGLTLFVYLLMGASLRRIDRGSVDGYKLRGAPILRSEFAGFSDRARDAQLGYYDEVRRRLGTGATYIGGVETYFGPFDVPPPENGVQNSIYQAGDYQFIDALPTDGMSGNRFEHHSQPGEVPPMPDRLASLVAGECIWALDGWGKSRELWDLDPKIRKEWRKKGVSLLALRPYAALPAGDMEQLKTWFRLAYAVAQRYERDWFFLLHTGDWHLAQNPRVNPRQYPGLLDLRVEPWRSICKLLGRLSK